MKSILLHSLALLAVAGSSFGQAAGEPLKVKVDVKKVAIGEQGTPEISAGNVTDKRWKPKKWVEVDIEFEIKLATELGGRNGSYPSMQMNIYLGLQHATKEGKVEVIKGTLNLVNVPAGEECHALAYVSPATLKSIFQKDNVMAGTDIKAWGVEVIVEGQRIAGESSLGKTNAWWEAAEKFQMLDGLLLSKAETPFGVLWGDYDVPVAKK